MKTVSYELELRLKEVADKHGVVLPESYFEWHTKIDSSHHELIVRGEIGYPPKYEIIDAHTADELMDGMPKSIYDEEITSMDHYAHLIIEWNINGSPLVSYINEDDINEDAAILDVYFKTVLSKSIADALAQMAIWLIENGYVKGVA